MFDNEQTSKELLATMTTLAQQAALRHGAGLSYTPQNQAEASVFKPHLWVISAMLEAYVEGGQATLDTFKATYAEELDDIKKWHRQSNFYYGMSAGVALAIVLRLILP